MAKRQQRLVLSSFSLPNGRLLSEAFFPVPYQGFMGTMVEQPKLLNCGEDSLVLVTDGNGCFFPLVKDCLKSIRDPPALNLPPVGAIGVGLHNVRPMVSGIAKKNRAMIAVFTIEV